jgi:hypothetical protein
LQEAVLEGPSDPVAPQFVKVYCSLNVGADKTMPDPASFFKALLESKL